jgi:hypothetical protein
MSSNAAYTLHTIHLHDATLDEEDSWLFLQHYNVEKTFNSVYKYPKMNIDSFHALASSFALFYAKVTDSKDNVSIPSNHPINVFRYVMLEDGSWSHYYTVKRKLGYIVEGMYWSNGMVYQVRSDDKYDFKLYEMTLNVDMLTKTMYNLPEE